MNLDYPLKFEPILKEKIWGGEKLKNLLLKKTEKLTVGESWEISDVDRSISIVSNGELKGQSLKNLLIMYRDSLLGKKVFQRFSYKFPLLIKFIDAREELSIQVHPNNTLAKKRHNSFGKTEMWYVLQADKDSNLIVGFKKDSNITDYQKHLKNNSLLELLNVDKVKKGDVFFIPPGRVHAIGAGVMLAEIQQSSDITYRIYDWERPDSYGHYRELHTENALEAIDYNSMAHYKTDFDIKLNKPSNIIDCKYFTTNILSIDSFVNCNHEDKDSFVIYMCVKGKVNFIYGNNEVESLNYGETVLVPASLKKFKINSKIKSKLLEIYIK
jgi:mannose-6-phosphate isomerase